ncbi:MAG TPA: protein-disulfide reductase DsbD domain-containing protein [Hyphomicrobium sp.]|nr:protein-disulfide reductase DsbD domain-containing protein [Hyphomicrobium sp.]
MTCLKTPFFQRTFAMIFALVVAASSGTTDSFAASSEWGAAHKTKARLLSGKTNAADGDRLLAFIEIELEPGWKTYWRTPGDAGGLPPAFDWSKSSNLAETKVLFPAPQRFTDKSGNTIGYHDGLVLPVLFTPRTVGEPVNLVLGLQYGICKDVCIPIEMELVLDVTANDDEPAPADVLAALDAVPRAQDKLKPGDPALIRAEAVLGGPSPKITLEARFPNGAAGADAFLEAPNNLFLPLPAKVGEGADGKVTFEAGLGADVDLAALKGKPVTVTLVGETGASFATFVAQ